MEFSSESYSALVQSLFERHQSVQSAGFTSGAYKPGLGNMLGFARALGDPQRRLRTVHVAGTNGKGSVCSMLAAALAATGLKVGLYTSPHLVDFRERAKIVTSGGFEMISEREVWDFLTCHDTDLEGLSFFEITTGLAFWWFDRSGVDLAVIETGLGGRLDSTNIITPELSVITSIGLDHCAILGDTRAAIAAEKAGIFKPGVPALVASFDDETAPVFEKTASGVHCPLFFADSLSDEPDASHIDLRGPCQGVNLRTVLCALELLGVEADMDAISRAAALTGFRGRWERLSDDPETICDIGHNPAALQCNFERLRESGRPLVIVYGVMADKDLDGIAPLMPSGAEYILVAPATVRALRVEDLRARLASLRPDLRTRAAGSVAEGVETAFRTARSVPGSIIYIGGSTFVVSEAIVHLESEHL